MDGGEEAHLVVILGELEATVAIRSQYNVRKGLIRIALEPTATEYEEHTFASKHSFVSG